MIDCKEATYLSSKREEGRITFRQRLELAFHFFICKYCSGFVKNSDIIARVLTRERSVQLSDTEKEKMQQDIDGMRSK